MSKKDDKIEGITILVAIVIVIVFLCYENLRYRKELIWTSEGWMMDYTSNWRPNYGEIVQRHEEEK